MTNDDGHKPEGAPERSPKAGVGAPSGVDGNSGLVVEPLGLRLCDRGVFEP
jgi:hypothetical protein